MEDQVLLPPNIEEIPPPGLALVEELDKLLLVQVRGGGGPAGSAVQASRTCGTGLPLFCTRDSAGSFA